MKTEKKLNRVEDEHFHAQRSIVNTAIFPRISRKLENHFQKYKLRAEAG